MMSFLVRTESLRPLTMSVSAAATAFFAIGLFLILVDAFFFYQILALASSPLSTRAVIGVHLYPSEIWFLFVGNSLLLAALGRDRLVVPAYIVRRAKPLFIVLGVYSVWFVFGAAVGNSWAIQEFREMVFAGLSLPAILYFARYVDARWLMTRILVPVCLLAPPMISVLALAGVVPALHNSVLMLSSFAASYYLYRVLNISLLAIVPLAVVAAVFLLVFAKPTVALLLFVVLVTALLSAHLNPTSVRWMFSRFKLRMVAIALAVLGLLVLMMVGINIYYDGLIEALFRYYFLKERFTSAGAVHYGDMSGGRLAIWREAVVGWSERPLFGHGLGATVTAFGSGLLEKTQLHNYPVQALHNTGLLGFCTLTIAWAVWFRRTLAMLHLVPDAGERAVPATMLVFVLGIFFFGLYGHSLSYPPVALLFWLCVGFLTVSRDENAEN